MGSQEGRPAKVLSCSSCRGRKIKCDKAQPVCLQCSRFGFECVYPSRKPTRRAPRPRQTELLDRISRLENIVGQADPTKLKQLEEEIRAGSKSADVLSEREAQSPEPVGSPSQPVGRYLSAEFWGHLCAEVEGIRQALDQPSDDDDDDEGTSPESVDAASSTPGAPSGFIFGNPDHSEKDPLIHPPPHAMAHLWAAYIRNVDPLMKILHRPTIAKMMQAVTEFPTGHSLSRGTIAVLFAIYFCAATTLKPDECIEKLGENYEAVTTRYRNNVERALAEADYLNGNSLEALQAFALYTSMIRCYSHNRSSWALTALLARLAQGQNLHRDGDGKQYTPFVGEMRRRLWYFIIVLDVRGSEDRGSDAVLAKSCYDTKMPTPIDDEDFGPESTQPLIPKESGPAENVILMCTAKCSSIFGHMAHPPNAPEGQTQTFVFSEDEMVKHIRDLEDRFIHTAVHDHLPSVYAAEISRLVILKLWLNIQYPFTGNVPSIRPRVSRETMLRTALSVMDMRNRMTQREWMNRFDWWTNTYVQWHPLAVALAELCVQTEGELVDRAWEVVDRNFPSSRDNIADSSRGALWRPIKKLLKKAKAARSEALMRKLSIQEPSMVMEPAAITTTTTATATATTATTTTTTTTPSIPNTLPDAIMSMDFQEPLPLLPDNFDSAAMDPSILFNYPPELLMMNVETGMGQGPSEWTMWNEFLNDTKMDASPGSGAADST